MGSDPERSVVDADAQSWDVKRLYVGDGSLVPHTLSVNPSLTIMALATASPSTSTPIPTGTSRDRARPRPRAPLAHRAADAEAGGEPRLLPRDPRHGGRGRARRLGLPARLRRLRALVAEADGLAAVGRRAPRLPHLQPRGARAPGRGARGRAASPGEWLDGDLGHGRGLQLPRPRRAPHRAVLRVRALRRAAGAPAGAEEPAAPLSRAAASACAISTTSTSWPSTPARTASSASATWACG